MVVVEIIRGALWLPEMFNDGHDRGRGHRLDLVPNRRDGRDDRSSLRDSLARKLCAYPSRDGARCHGGASDYHAIHNYGASNRGLANRRRPSSYRNYHDRLFVILQMAAG